MSAVFGIDFDEPRFSVVLNPVESLPARKKHKPTAILAKHKPSLKIGTKKREAKKTKKEIAERSPSKKAKTRTTVVKKTVSKSDRKSMGKKVRKKTEQY